MNITDVDDKIIRNAVAAATNRSDDYTAHLHPGLSATTARSLRLETPGAHHAAPPSTSTKWPRPSQRLAAGGHTYASDGSIYFRIATFPEYGKLSHNDFSGIRAGARVDVDEYEKADARDFALWKAPKEGEPFWETTIGPGRPGWHIECSVMAIKYLGETLDIHAGGIDLVFPHHENEIAQSEVAHRQALRALLDACRVPAWSKARRCPSRWAITLPCATSGPRLRAGSRALPAGLGALPQDAEFHFRRSEIAPPRPSTGCAISSCAWKPRSFAEGSNEQLAGAHRSRRRSFDEAWTTISIPPKPWPRCSNSFATPTRAMDAGEFRCRQRAAGARIPGALRLHFRRSEARRPRRGVSRMPRSNR